MVQTLLRYCDPRRSRGVMTLIAGAAMMLGAAACSGGHRPPTATPQPQKKDTAPNTPRAMATRAELEALLADKSGKVSDEERNAVRERLAHGDLQPGDRIAMRVIGEQTLTDSFVVKPTRTVLLPNIGEISVDRVLRSELNDYLKTQLGRFVRNPQIDATALVRVSLSGAVGKPGFYNLPADLLASDAIMTAGGPGGTADPAKTEIRRAGVLVATKEQTALAINQGASLDQLNVQSGDEIIVGKRGTGLTGVLRTMGLLSGALFGIVAITRIF